MKFFKNIVCSLLLLTSFVATADNLVAKNSELPGNFDTVIEGAIYRGARPLGKEQIQTLAKLGVKTILNLQGGDYLIPKIGPILTRGTEGERPEEIAAEAEIARVENISSLSIPMASLRPMKKADALKIAQAIQFMNDPANQPVFVHCAHGKDRTGLIVAMHRMVYENWNVLKAHKEMRDHGHIGIHMATTFSLDYYLFSTALKSYIERLIVDPTAEPGAELIEEGLFTP